jgi:HEAT repeat protein
MQDVQNNAAEIGTKQAVPALAALLADPKLAHYARYGLEPIPDPSVDKALRDALGKIKGRPLVGVINSIGQRKDAEVADAAAAALGRISGTPAATKPEVR